MTTLSADQIRVKRDAERLLKEQQRIHFAVAFHHIKRDQRLNFTGRLWLKDIYASDEQKTVVRKSVQCGITEFLILNTIWLAGVRGLYVFYVLPTIVLRNRLVKMRVDRSLADSPHYSKLQRSSMGAATVDAVEVKHIGKGAATFVGSNSESAFVEFPADVVIVDEKDRCHRENTKLAYDRYSASKFKLLWEVSNPTLEGVAISEDFENSKGKHWHVLCEHCNEKQPLDFFENVVRKTGDRSFEVRDRLWTPDCGRDVAALCRRCEKPVDRLFPGKWVAQRPDHDVDGYTISKLFSPDTTLKEILFDARQGFFPSLSDPGKLQVFHNNTLGLPHSPPGTSLSEEVFAASTRDYHCPSFSRRPTTMGVDVGTKFDVRISDYPTREGGGRYRRLLHAGRYDKPEELDDLMQRFNVRCAVVDCRPETRVAKAFQSRFPGKVWLAQFVKDAVKEKQVNQELMMLSVDRTQTIDAMVAQYGDGTAVVPQEWRTLAGGEWLAHMLVPKRDVDWTAEPPRASWVSNGADHQFFAEVYDTMAARVMTEGHDSCIASDPSYMMTAKSQEEEEAEDEYEELRSLLYPEEVAQEKASETVREDDWILDFDEDADPDL